MKEIFRPSHSMLIFFFLQFNATAKCKCNNKMQLHCIICLFVCAKQGSNPAIVGLKSGHSRKKNRGDGMGWDAPCGV